MSSNPKGRNLAVARKSRPEKTAIKPAKQYPPPPAGLNAKQAAFCAQYMVDFNCTQAAIRAGYSKKTASQIGSRLLGNVHVSAEITARRGQLASNLADISEERIRLEMARCAFANMGDYMQANPDGSPRLDFGKLTRNQTAALQEVTVEEFKDGRSDRRQVRRIKFKLVDKRGSLELLARHKGMLSDKVEVDHKHQHLILAVMLKEIAAGMEGKPIVDDAVQDLPDQKPEGEAAA